MMKNFNWKAGVRRAAFFMVLYAVILYVMNILFPESFGIGQAQIPGLLVNAVFFFLILTAFFAFTEKRRAQRLADLRAQKGKQEKPEREDGGSGPLKGKPNPNTSRKKSRRRR